MGVYPHYLHSINTASFLHLGFRSHSSPKMCNFLCKIMQLLCNVDSVHQYRWKAWKSTSLWHLIFVTIFDCFLLIREVWPSLQFLVLFTGKSSGNKKRKCCQSFFRLLFYGMQTTVQGAFVHILHHSSQTHEK